MNGFTKNTVFCSAVVVVAVVVVVEAQTCGMNVRRRRRLHKELAENSDPAIYIILDRDRVECGERGSSAAAAELRLGL